MLKNSLLLLSLFALLACSNSDDANDIANQLNNGPQGLFKQEASKQIDGNSLIGLWESNILTINNVELALRMNIRPRKVSVTAMCSFADGRYLFASTSSSATVTGNSVTIHSSRTKMEIRKIDGQDYDCTASLTQGTQEMIPQNGSITAPGSPMVLTKVRN